MKVIRVALADADFLALRHLAQRDRREPRMQARVILERAIAARGRGAVPAAGGAATEPSSDAR